MKFEDIVALAKAGYSPKNVKELLEYVESSQAIKEAPSDIKPEDVPEHIDEPQEKEPVVEEKKETAEDFLGKFFS